MKKLLSLLLAGSLAAVAIVLMRRNAKTTHSREPAWKPVKPS